MCTQDLVSVVVPVYNAEMYLHENVESILKQTYSDLEIIYVCAGCTDTSVEIIQKYIQHDSRMILCIEQENHGPAYSRNIGMQMATGDWIIFLDSDDLFESDMIEVMWKQAVNEKADICCCYWDCFDEDSFGKPGMTDEMVRYLCSTYPVINVSNERKHIFQLISLNAWTKLIHKTVYQRNTVNFGDFPNCEDAFFSMMIVMEAAKIVYTDQKLIHYRMNINRETQTTMMLNKKSYVWEVADAIFQQIKVKGNDRGLKKSFYNFVCTIIFNASQSSIFYSLYDDLYNIYLKKWEMLNCDVAKVLSYFNQEVYDKVCNGDKAMHGTEMAMQAKVHFVSDICKKGVCGIWGCGDLGQKFLERLSIADADIQHVFDSDRSKWGTQISGYIVEQFMGDKIDSVIVTSSRYYAEIKKQIGSRAGQIYDLEKEIFV